MVGVRMTILTDAGLTFAFFVASRWRFFEHLYFWLLAFMLACWHLRQLKRVNQLNRAKVRLKRMARDVYLEAGLHGVSFVAFSPSSYALFRLQRSRRHCELLLS
jgi:hypothetical protein